MPAIPNPDLHPWALSPAGATALQRELAGRVVTTRPLDLDGVRLVAGVDVSVKEGISRAAVAVLSFPTLELVEVARAVRPTPFPYISGLLSFREGPVILEAYQNLECTPDALIFDGQGLAHPRRLGLACHIGLWLERPTVGCGKTRLIGKHSAPASEKGSVTSLTHRGEVIGCVLRTRTGVKPVYVSVGHLATLESARALVLACAPRYRLPEPIRQAHHLAALP
jgi:deoxyribonuclease V